VPAGRVPEATDGVLILLEEVFESVLLEVKATRRTAGLGSFFMAARIGMNFS
jgi:hypothetical protein